MMKLYSVLTIVFFSLFGTLGVQAQEEGILTGSLSDQKEETIPFATVAMMKLPDSTIVTGTTTDMDGSFQLDTPEKGNYLLRFSAIGFQSKFTNEFEVSSPDYRKNFGRVILPAEVTMLNEVMVQTWRPRIEMEAGKLVVQIEGTAMAAGSSAFEVISKSPGISADQDGNLMLNGKNGVRIMINGRLTYLSAEQLMTLLEAMPAENIKSIELIHNPSAKHDAEGSAGIINIELKKNIALGLNGSIYGGAEFNRENWYNAGANLNYNVGKWNSYFSADIAKRGRTRTQEVVRNFTYDSEYDYYHQTGDQFIIKWAPSFMAGVDYEVNKNHTIGAIANYTFFDESGSWDTQTQLGIYGQGDLQEIASLNRSDRDYKNGRFNLHYTGELDTVGTKLAANLDYVRLSTDRDSDFTNNYFFPVEDIRETESLYNSSISEYDIIAGKVDLALPLNKTSQFSIGVKGSRVISESDLRFYSGEEGAREYDETRSNSFRYEEQIYAAYAIYDNKLSDNWNIQLGLRAEKTLGKGISATMEEINETDYLDLFPNLQVSQKVSDNYEINYSYSRRINRPDYSTLNPFLFYLDPYSYIVGNPDLEPEIISSFGISQSLFGKYLLNLSYDYTDRVMGEYPRIDKETGQTIFTTANMDDRRIFSGVLVVPVELAPFWSTENTAVLTQTYYDIPFEEGLVENDQLYYSLQSNHRISLPWDINMELNAKYFGPVAAGIYTVGERYFVDLGLKRSFMDERLDVTLKATDIFEGMRMDVYAEYPGSTFDMNQYFYNRGVSVNLRYSFKNGKSQKQARQESLEELNRAGG